MCISIIGLNLWLHHPPFTLWGRRFHWVHVRGIFLNLLYKFFFFFFLFFCLETCTIQYLKFLFASSFISYIYLIEFFFCFVVHMSIMVRKRIWQLRSLNQLMLGDAFHVGMNLPARCQNLSLSPPPPLPLPLPWFIKILYFCCIFC